MRITLCGSAKFEGMFHLWNKKLTLAGHTVYGLAVYPSYMEGNKNWYTEIEKEILDLVHLDKILNSDAIVVIDVDEYYGVSTTREIQWARMKNKKVYWITEYSKNINKSLAYNDAWAGVLL
jgi:hypothetical protein